MPQSVSLCGGGVQLLFGQCPFAQSFFNVGRLPLQLKRGIKTKRFPHHSIFVVSTVCNNKHCSWWCNNVQVVHSFQEQCLQRSGTQSRTALENVGQSRFPSPPRHASFPVAICEDALLPRITWAGVGGRVAEILFTPHRSFYRHTAATWPPSTFYFMVITPSCCNQKQQHKYQFNQKS